jgi:hypothetical protein
MEKLRIPQPAEIIATEWLKTLHTLFNRFEEGSDGHQALGLVAEELAGYKFVPLGTIIT